MKKSFHFHNRYLAVLVLICSVFTVTAFASTDATTIPNISLSPFKAAEDSWKANFRNDYAPPDPGDFSNQSWVEAFSNMHAKMKKEFAYTEHKKIDWDNLNNTYMPMIVAAMQSHDLDKYYVALRSYIVAINEGHTRIYYLNQKAIQTVLNNINKNMGGGYGMAIKQINDGSEIVSYLLPGGPAENAGIQAKAKILAWNGKPIAKAVAEKSTLWADEWRNGLHGVNTAVETKAAMQYEQERLLTRGAVGDKATVIFQNPGSSKIETVVLEAVADVYKTYTDTSLYTLNENYPSDPNKVVWHQTLPSGYGYIRVANEENCNSTSCPSYDRFVTAMNDLKNAPGIILDIRGNSGGNDGFSSAIVGFFTSKKGTLLNALPYNKLTEKFDTVWPLPIDLQEPKYNGPVVVLTDIGVYCAGEAIAYGMQQLTQAHIMSYFPNTGASYSYANTIVMPDGYMVSYPVRRTADDSGKLIIEGDSELNGGVKTPADGIIPMDADTAYAVYTTHSDPEIDSAVEWLKKHS